MADEGKTANVSFFKQRIDQDLKEALKAKDSLKLNVLRMIKSEIRYKEIEKRSELCHDEVISVLSSSIKKRRDSIQQFEKAGRDDLASKEKTELEVILSYLPEQLTEEELLRLVNQTIKEVNAAGPSDLGRVMKHIMSNVRGKADGKKVNQLVVSQLQAISSRE